MLLFGTLIHRYFDQLGGLLKGKVIWWLLAYAVLAFATRNLATGVGGKTFAAASLLVMRVMLAMLTVSAAYSFPGLSQFLLRGNDISYGLYIYHLPVYNLFIHYGQPSVTWFPLALASAILCGCASWTYLERRMLTLKDRFIQHATTGVRTEDRPVTSGVVEVAPQADSIS
jgi:peptidoglycan/LPS O-acetylase OafA/YrhL